MFGLNERGAALTYCFHFKQRCTASSVENRSLAEIKLACSRRSESGAQRKEPRAKKKAIKELSLRYSLVIQDQ